MPACNLSCKDSDRLSLTAAAAQSSLLAARLSLKAPLSLSIVTPAVQAACPENVLVGKRVLVVEQKAQVAAIVASYLSRWNMTPVRFLHQIFR